MTTAATGWIQDASNKIRAYGITNPTQRKRLVCALHPRAADEFVKAILSGPDDRGFTSESLMQDVLQGRARLLGIKVLVDDNAPYPFALVPIVATEDIRLIAPVLPCDFQAPS